MQLLPTLLVGAAGGLIYWRLNLPAGGVPGAMPAITLLNLGGVHLASTPAGFRLVEQIVTGTALGSMVAIETVDALSGVLVPTIVMVLLMTIAPMVVRWLFGRN